MTLKRPKPPRRTASLLFPHMVDELPIILPVLPLNARRAARMCKENTPFLSTSTQLRKENTIFFPY